MRMKLITEDPIVAIIGEMGLHEPGIKQMAEWVKEVRPECVPSDSALSNPYELFPHGGKRHPIGLTADFTYTEPGYSNLSGNELLVELAGRKCYNSFGDKAGRKTNHEYINNTQDGDIPHASIMYHAKMSFFVAGISRRVSHELIRHYVGADRDEEGSPSQESTRYVEHSGRYIAPPRLLNTKDKNMSEQSHRVDMLSLFAAAMADNRRVYLRYIESEFDNYRQNHDGSEPSGMNRKRIYEAASAFLSHSAETSFIWTTNPIALAKLIRERQHEAADLEFQRLARVWKTVAKERWPNLFPQPWMTECKIERSQEIHTYLG